MRDIFLQAALDQAIAGNKYTNKDGDRGIPIGSVLVCDGKVLGRGHNQRVQQESPILHAEIDCLRDAGRLEPEIYKRSILYTTLSPCSMCSGAALLYGIPKVVIGENRNFVGAENYLRDNGVTLEIVDDPQCYDILKGYIRLFPKIWYEDIGRSSQGERL